MTASAHVSRCALPRKASFISVFTRWSDSGSRVGGVSGEATMVKYPSAMKKHPDDFRVREGHKGDLDDWSTKIGPFFDSMDGYKGAMAAQVQELADLQKLLYASNEYALLLIFQALDAAGKDGAVSHVMSGVNPQGCQVYSFKPPSPEELEHDFLWRTTRVLPERGRIGIFNRSYYEEVLIARVHPALLRGEGLTNGNGKHHKHDVWDRRYQSLRDQERHLHRNGTRIVKFFLHLSKDAQRKHIQHRNADPAKR